MEELWEMIDRTDYEDDAYGERLSGRYGGEECAWVCLWLCNCIRILNGLWGCATGAIRQEIYGKQVICLSLAGKQWRQVSH